MAMFIILLVVGVAVYLIDQYLISRSQSYYDSITPHDEDDADDLF